MLEDINDWQAPCCCKDVCTEWIGEEECRRLREVYLRSSQMDRRALLREHISVDEFETSRFKFNGQEVCWNLVIMTLNVSRTLIANILELPSANATSLPGRIRRNDGSFRKKSGVISFLRILADEVADELPNSLLRHLPHGNKRIVYGLYKECEERYQQSPCSQSHFYAMWKAFAQNIKCRRKHGFTVCDTCTQFKEGLLAIARLQGKEESRAILKKRFSTHIKQVHTERAEYRMIQAVATENPDKVLSVIIAGADQKNFGFPRFPTKTKRETGHALKQKITGVLFHGALNRQDLLCFFTAAENVPSGANQTVDALCRGLFALLEKRAALGLGGVPEVLYIQLDNTAKDNKNRFLFSFCDFLVHMGIFMRVTLFPLWTEFCNFIVFAHSEYFIEHFVLKRKQ